MSQISREQVQHVAHLARLTLTPEEEERMTRDLNKILMFFQKLNQLDTDDVPPTSHVLELTNVMRDDVKRPSWPLEEVLKNAPDEENGMFRVPAVIEE
ncbi:MAG: asparaginyl/glutamyl-tRNA amidotransferase subunit C [Bacillaceae bacterium G1]|nr:Asp-tRNA(Asn)/Glu-tRNA(Gln) amidotransferase GatCAB subunit C [Bacillota bacterium]OJF16927.1 MAG: asparaginyl/glutamyl-tRNA amidotransferase subunit C [Bacillaceae bacterium G1]